MTRGGANQAAQWTVKFIGLVGFLLFAVLPLGAQHTLRSLENESHENGVIDGRVLTVLGRTIPTTVTLSLVTTQGEVVAERPASTSGEFEFANLPHISYVLKTSAEGFETNTQVLNLGRSSGRITLNIVLQPAAKEPAPIEASKTFTDDQAPKQARKEFEKGNQALEKRNVSAARDHLAKAVKEFPCYARAQTELAIALIAENKRAQAETALKKATECDPGFPDPYLQMGALYNTQKDFKAGVAALTEGTRHAPGAWQFYFQLGVAHYGLGMFPQAEADYLKAQSLAPPQAEDIQVKLADTLLKQGKYDKAYSEMQAYLTAHPEGRFAEKIRQIMRQMESAGAVRAARAEPAAAAPKP